MSEKLVEVKDLEISFGEGKKNLLLLKMQTSLLIKEKRSLLLENQEVEKPPLDVLSLA